MKHPNKISTRTRVQTVSFLLCLVLGAVFYVFVTQLSQGQTPMVSRPAGVEAFLPISALLSFRYWVETGIFSTIHPAALVLLLIICATALLAKRGFCSWICPVGFISDLLAKVNRRLFPKRPTLPRWLDRGLMLVKYGLLAFFVYTIFFTMPVQALAQFIHSPYNQFADIKMLEFFTQMTAKTGIILTVLALLSTIFPYFWCRYLCPYGALLGVLSFLSLGRIKRNPEACINCGQCEKNCPGQIKILSGTTVTSPECSACLTCTEVCPKTDAIAFHAGPRRLGTTGVAVIIVGLFALGITTAKLTGYWNTSIPLAAYQAHLAPKPPMGRMPFPMGKMPPNALPKDPEKLQRMMEKIQQMQQRSQMKQP